MARRLADQPLSDTNFDPKEDSDAASPDRYVTACAIAHLVTEDPAYAIKAHDAMLAWTKEWCEGELGRGTQSLIGAIAHECCCAAWTVQVSERNG